MNRDNFYKNLEEVLGIKILDIPALYSGLNMFFDALDMDLRNGTSAGPIDYNDSLECIKRYSSEKSSYDLSVFYNKKDQFITLVGKYNDMIFNFNTKNCDDDVYEIPYLLKLNRNFDERDYNLEIDSSIGRKTKFIIAKSYDEEKGLYDELTFYSNRTDLENVVGIIKSFADNPSYVFEAYKHVLENKKIIFTSEEIDSAKKFDRLLVTEQGKLLKKVKNVK